MLWEGKRIAYIFLTFMRLIKSFMLGNTKDKSSQNV